MGTDTPDIGVGKNFLTRAPTTQGKAPRMGKETVYRGSTAYKLGENP